MNSHVRNFAFREFHILTFSTSALDFLTGFFFFLKCSIERLKATTGSTRNFLMGGADPFDDRAKIQLAKIQLLKT